MKKEIRMFKLMPISLKVGWLLIGLLYLVAFIGGGLHTILTGKVGNMWWVCVMMLDMILIPIVGLLTLAWRVTPAGKKVDEEE